MPMVACCISPIPGYTTMWRTGLDTLKYLKAPETRREAPAVGRVQTAVLATRSPVVRPPLLVVLCSRQK